MVRAIARHPSSSPLPEIQLGHPDQTASGAGSPRNCASALRLAHPRASPDELFLGDQGRPRAAQPRPHSRPIKVLSKQTADAIIGFVNPVGMRRSRQSVPRRVPPTPGRRAAGLPRLRPSASAPLSVLGRAAATARPSPAPHNSAAARGTAASERRSGPVARRRHRTSLPGAAWGWSGPLRSQPMATRLPPLRAHHENADGSNRSR